MSKYGEAVGSKFRLSICLKRLYSDERRLCYVTARSGLRVRWLARRLRRLFSLPGHFCLLSAGHLLPPDETLALLSPDDVVEVIPKPYNIFKEMSESEDELELDTSVQNTNENTQSEKQTTSILVQSKPSVKQFTVQHLDDKHEGSIIGTINPYLKEQRVENVDPQHIQQPESEDLQQRHQPGNGDLHQLGNQERKLDEVDNTELNEVKRKALELLEQCSDVPAKRKRKRVRRRKPRTEAESEDVVDMSELCAPGCPDPGDKQTDTNVLDKLDKPAVIESPILRNNVEQNRTARLVYSLF